MEKNENKESPKKHRIAHSTIRRHLNDYNDGANVTDQLGNDDQNENFGTFYSGSAEEENLGKVAYGNDELLEDEDGESNDVEDMT